MTDEGSYSIMRRQTTHKNKMARLTEEQVIQRAIREDIWKVHVHESERGWGSDSWDSFFDSYQEAYD